MRAHARAIFDHALDAVRVDHAFERHVQASRGVLRVGEDLYNLNSYSRIYVVAIGKAAHTMVSALAAHIGAVATGIVVCPDNVKENGQVMGLRYFHGGHPIPNEESVRSAEAILKALPQLDSQALVIYLLSGGGSAMCEAPLGANLTLDDIVETYHALVHCGAPITEVNAIRKHLSAVKGGRLAEAAAKHHPQQVTIALSDVPDHSLDALASGPTLPDTSTSADCYRIAEKYGLIEEFPPKIREYFDKKLLLETLKTDDATFVNTRWLNIANNTTALKAAEEKARELGFAVETDASCDDQGYSRTADYLLELLRKMQQLNPGKSVCLLSGGEVTVKVPGKHGAGGRNQHFVLDSAVKIASENICVLSASTDGIDGNSTAAGAIADGQTLSRYSLLGVSASLGAHLEQFDSNSIFKQLGDEFVTGPTGTNVRDVRVMLAW